MDKQYRVVVPGIEGGGSQVFEADTPDELAQQFQQAQENATAKIRELAQQNENYEQQIQQLTPQAQAQPGAAGPDGFNRTKYFNLLYENPIEAAKYSMGFVLGAPVDAFIADYQNVRAGSIAGMQNMVNAQFAQKHPELLQVPQADDIHNSEQISQILTANGWTYNLNNLEAAYAVAKTQGKLKLNAAPSGPEAMLAAAPSVVSRPSGATDSTATEEEFLRTAPLDKVKVYLEKKYPNGARV